MIPIDKLRGVTTIVCHQNGPGSPCPDGVASALILRDVLPDAAIVFASHDEAGQLLPCLGMLFCDVTPPASRASLFVEAGAIVLDHHRTARSVVELFGAHGVFADENAEPGVSGALLAYREVWLPLRGQNEDALLFAKVAGVRDTWQRSSERWSEACEQAAALVFWPFERWPVPFFARDGMNATARAMFEIGGPLVDKRARETQKHISEGWRFETSAGTRVCVVATRETSDIADALDDAVDVVIGFSFANGASIAGGHVERMIVSTRSHTKFDCAGFCKANGGGGHARAAGFSLTLRVDDLQPFTFVAEMLDVWERDQRGVRSKPAIF